LAGGLLVHDGRLTFELVVFWIAAISWAGGMGVYALGRWLGRWLRRRWPGTRRIILRVVRVVRRHPWRASVAVRFAFGLRYTLPLACGVSRVPVAVFAIGSAASALLWASLYTALGWGFGRTVLAIFDHVRRYEKQLVVAILVGTAIAFVLMRRRHVEEAVVEVLDHEKHPPRHHPE
jgi:membrane protein DedA with SNARE-associated domain